MRKFIIPFLLLCFTAGCFSMIHMDNMKLEKALDAKDNPGKTIVVIVSVL